MSEESEIMDVVKCDGPLIPRRQSLCYISLLGTGATVPHCSANTYKAIADIAGKGPCSTTECGPSAFAGESRVVWCGQQVGVVAVAPAEKLHMNLQFTPEIAN